MGNQHGIIEEGIVVEKNCICGNTFKTKRGFRTIKGPVTEGKICIECAVIEQAKNGWTVFPDDPERERENVKSIYHILG